MVISTMRGVLLGALLVGSFADTALAQQPTQAQANAIRQSCRADYQAHCSNAPTGGTAALQCLKDNAASLSPACRTAVAATGGAAATPTPTPTTSAPAPAKPAPVPATQASRPPPPMPLREEVALVRRSCGGDFRMHCPGVTLGGGRAVACLADHQESLSPPCREALAAARR
jgi:hypothetical protein